MNETEIERLVVRIVGEGSDVQKMFKETEASAKQAAATCEKAAGRVEGLAGGIKGFASAALAGLAALGARGFLEDTFAKFSEAEKGELRLVAALEAGGRAVESTLASYKEFAEQMQEITVLDDDAVLGLLRTAESYNLSGDAAKRAAQDAIALAAATGGSEEAMMRLTAAVAKGDIATAMRFSRMVPQLRGIRDESEFVARFQQLLAAGMKTATREAETASGRLKQLGNAYDNFKEELGGVVAEGIMPVIEWLKQAVKLIAGTSAGTKQAIVIIAAFTAGLLALTAVFPLLGLAMAPVLAAFGLIKASLLFILSPIGLVLAAIAGLVYWTGAGGKALDWFGRQWAALMEHLGPAIQGIKDAIKEGDLELAFNTMWAQVKLSFAEATQGLRDIWTDFVTWVQKGWEDVGAGLALGIIEAKRMVKQLSQEEADNMKWQVRFNRDMEKLRLDSMAKITKQLRHENIQRLTDERDALVKQAADLAQGIPGVLGMGPFLKNANELGRGTGKAFKQGVQQEIQSIDNVLAGSQEARARILEFQERLSHPERFLKDKKGGVGQLGPAPPPNELDRFDDEVAKREMRRQTERLDEIARNTRATAANTAEPIEVEEVGLG